VKRTPSPDAGFDDPSLDELREFPWSGDGDDPLEQLWEQS